jgi:hypothetical protein
MVNDDCNKCNRYEAIFDGGKRAVEVAFWVPGDREAIGFGLLDNRMAALNHAEGFVGFTEYEGE